MVYNYFVTVLVPKKVQRGVRSISFNLLSDTHFDLRRWDQKQEEQFRKECRETLLHTNKIEEDTIFETDFEIASIHPNK